MFRHSMVASLLVPAAAFAPASAARAAFSGRASAAPRLASINRLAMVPPRGGVRMFGLFDMLGGGSKDELIKPEQV
jgi:hypothetical protein